MCSKNIIGSLLYYVLYIFNLLKCYFSIYKFVLRIIYIIVLPNTPQKVYLSIENDLTCAFLTSIMMSINQGGSPGTTGTINSGIGAAFSGSVRGREINCSHDQEELIIV